MSTVCISNCVNDTRVPARTNYVNLHKWPEIDVGFVKSTVGTAAKVGGGGQFFHPRVRVVDSISCRQLYIRSAYTFTREETVQERTKKCFGRVREKVTSVRKKRKLRPRRRRRLLMMKRVKKFSCAALCSIFHRLLSCTATVDVVEPNANH